MRAVNKLLCVLTLSAALVPLISIAATVQDARVKLRGLLTPTATSNFEVKEHGASTGNIQIITDGFLTAGSREEAIQKLQAVGLTTTKPDIAIAWDTLLKDADYHGSLAPRKVYRVFYGTTAETVKPIDVIFPIGILADNGFEVDAADSTKMIDVARAKQIVADYKTGKFAAISGELEDRVLLSFNSLTYRLTDAELSTRLARLDDQTSVRFTLKGLH